MARDLPVFYVRNCVLEYLRDATDEQYGKLFRAASNYVNGIEPDFRDPVMAYYWSVLKENILLRKPRQTGRDHWNWKGGVTPKNQIERSSPRYAAWRSAVFERDNYTCQVCGTIGGELNAHHIVPWAQNKEMRFVVSNGITLCKSCHRKAHRKEG